MGKQVAIFLVAVFYLSWVVDRIGGHANQAYDAGDMGVFVLGWAIVAIAAVATAGLTWIVWPQSPVQQKARKAAPQAAAPSKKIVPTRYRPENAIPA
jgi:hypothetical protein